MELNAERAEVGVRVADRRELEAGRSRINLRGERRVWAQAVLGAGTRARERMGSS